MKPTYAELVIDLDATLNQLRAVRELLLYPESVHSRHDIAASIYVWLNDG